MFDPYKVSSEFYKKDDPTEAEQFEFVEAMEYLIKTDSVPYVYMFNLATYYRDIKNFDLERKYLEMALNEGCDLANIGLGYIWYYGYTGETDYGKAFRYFTAGVETGTTKCEYKIADMYLNGYFVDPDPDKYYNMICDLFLRVSPSRGISYSVPFPEVAFRLAEYHYLDEDDTEWDLDLLFDARDFLVERQMRYPFWGNIKTMRRILELTAAFCGNNFDMVDIYDILCLDSTNIKISFKYNGLKQELFVLEENGDDIVKYNDKWFRSPDEFLEKGRLPDGVRITTAIYDITELKKTILSD